MAFKTKAEIIAGGYNGQQIVDILADNDSYLRALIGGRDGASRLFLNSCFMIDQPNEGASVAAAAAAFGCDAVRLIKNGAGGFNGVTVADDNLITAVNKSRSGYKFTVSTAAGSPSSGDYYYGKFPVEGYRASRFGFGTPGANSGVLRATLLSSITAVVALGIKNSAGTYTFIKNVAVTAGVALDVDIPIPALTSGVWATNHLEGMHGFVCLGAGSGGLGTDGAWNASNVYAASGVNFMATNAATLEITNIDFVVGDVAPKLYLPTDLNAEFYRCYREYEKTFPVGVAPAQTALQPGYYFTQIVAAAGVQRAITWQHMAPKRIDNPATVTYNMYAANAQIRNFTRNNDASIAGVLSTKLGIQFQMTGSTGSAAGDVCIFHGTSDARL